MVHKEYWEYSLFCNYKVVIRATEVKILYDCCLSELKEFLVLIFCRFRTLIHRLDWVAVLIAYRTAHLRLEFSALLCLHTAKSTQRVKGGERDCSYSKNRVSTKQKLLIAKNINIVFKILLKAKNALT